MLLGGLIGLLEEPLDLCPLLVLSLRAEVGGLLGGDGALIVTHVIVVVGGDAFGLMGKVFGFIFDEIVESFLVDFTQLGLGAGVAVSSLLLGLGLSFLVDFTELGLGAGVVAVSSHLLRFGLSSLLFRLLIVLALVVKKVLLWAIILVTLVSEWSFLALRLLILIRLLTPSLFVDDGSQICFIILRIIEHLRSLLRHLPFPRFFGNLPSSFS